MALTSVTGTHITQARRNHSCSLGSHPASHTWQTLALQDLIHFLCVSFSPSKVFRAEHPFLKKLQTISAWVVKGWSWCSRHCECRLLPLTEGNWVWPIDFPLTWASPFDKLHAFGSGYSCKAGAQQSPWAKPDQVLFLFLRLLSALAALRDLPQQHQWDEEPTLTQRIVLCKEEMFLALLMCIWGRKKV